MLEPTWYEVSLSVAVGNIVATGGFGFEVGTGRNGISISEVDDTGWAVGVNTGVLMGAVGTSFVEFVELGGTLLLIVGTVDGGTSEAGIPVEVGDGMSVEGPVGPVGPGPMLVPDETPEDAGGGRIPELVPGRGVGVGTIGELGGYSEGSSPEEPGISEGRRPEEVPGMGMIVGIRPELVPGMGITVGSSPELVPGIGITVGSRPELVPGMGMPVGRRPELVPGITGGRSVGIADDSDAPILDIRLSMGPEGMGRGAVPVGTTMLDTSEWISEAMLEAMLEMTLGRLGTDEGSSPATDDTTLLTPDSITETALEIWETKDGTTGIGVIPAGADDGAVGPGAGAVRPAPVLGMTPGTERRVSEG